MHVKPRGAKLDNLESIPITTPEGEPVTGRPCVSAYRIGETVTVAELCA